VLSGYKNSLRSAEMIMKNLKISLCYAFYCVISNSFQATDPNGAHRDLNGMTQPAIDTG
jgi:hypothetical protein